jgi:hypothetical protein
VTYATRFIFCSRGPEGTALVPLLRCGGAWGYFSTDPGGARGGGYFTASERVVYVSSTSEAV